jgi:hypothetical protein
MNELVANRKNKNIVDLLYSMSVYYDYKEGRRI